MAVVQISRIQNRRGRRENLPQLASGEFGWAIDQQELYIGNGAVSEGAPAVGNTKILTEKDDLLGLAGQYAYQRDVIQTGVSIGSPVERTLQSKLDDVVSVRDFGAFGDGTDQTEKLQRAIDQLFINSATKGLYSSRVTLRIPAGEYLLTQPLYIPPYANIVGDGIDKTVINAAASANAFRTVNEDSVPGTPANDSTTDNTNQARQIVLKGMTIQHASWTDATLRLESCIESIFQDLKFENSWLLSDGYASIPIAISLNSGSTALNSDNNKFINCDYSGYVYPVYSDYDSQHNVFDIGKVELCGYGFAFGINSTIGSPGQATGPNYNIVSNYTFTDVYKTAIIVSNGRYNTSNNNKFIAVGNDGGDSSAALHPVIEFVYEGNTSVNDYFERTADLSVNQLYFPGSYPAEVKGPKDYKNNFAVTTSVGNYSSADDFLQLSIDTRGMIEVEYQYRAEINPGEVLRTGKLTIVYNQDNAESTISDEYTFTGNPTKASLLIFTGAINAGNKYVIQVDNSTLDSLSPEEDSFTFTIRHIA